MTSIFIHWPIGRASQIADILGEGSAFHKEHGFYLDAVNPDLPTLPSGWETRMVKVDLGTVQAYFLDIHDTAVSKYARGAENDYRWLEAGYAAGLLKIESVERRMAFPHTEFFDGDEKARAYSGLWMHKYAMTPEEIPSPSVLQYLRENAIFAEPPKLIHHLNVDCDRYTGLIEWADGQHAIQDIGKGNLVIHQTSAWADKPSVGLFITVQYRNGAVEWEPKPGKTRGLGNSR